MAHLPLQLLAEKYGMKEEELAPKVARMAKAGKPSTSGGSPTGTATAAGAARARSAATQSASPAATEGVGVSGSVHGTAAAAQAAAAAEADAQAALLMQQMQAQQEALEKAQAAALLQAQQAAAAQGGPSPMLEDALLGMSSNEQLLAAAAAAARPGAPPVPAPLGAAGPTNLHLLLDDEFLDEVFTPMLDGLVGAAAGGAPPSTTAASFLQMDAASAMDLDDMAGLEQLAEQLLPGLLPSHRMEGGPGATWPQATPTAPSGKPPSRLAMLRALLCTG